MKDLKTIKKEIKSEVGKKLEDAKSFYKLHRSTVNASIAAFVGALASTVVIAKKLGDNPDDEEEPKKPFDWRNDPDFEEADVEYNGERIHGAWFYTSDAGGGRIFFASDDENRLP